MTSLETTKLSTFLQSRGATVHESLELFGRARDGSERGCFAIEPIKTGELLLKLSRKSVITACDADDPCCAWMPEAARAASPMLRTALYLMREIALGESSVWHPYLSSLPKSYDTLEHWSQEELKALTGTSVHEELASLRDSSGALLGPARVLWDKSIAPIVQAAPEHWPQADLQSFLTACAAVRTRGFYDTAAGGGGPYMLPAIDMLNHARVGTATSLAVERSEDGGGVAEAGSSGAAASSSSTPSSLIFTMEAERDIQAGEEILHVYDHLDPGQLLLTYGFMPSGTEGALPVTARIRVESVLEACAAVRDQAAASADGPRLDWDPSAEWSSKRDACMKLLSSHKGVIGVSTVEPLPDALITVVLFMLMPGEEFKVLMGESTQGDTEDARRLPLLDGSALEGEPLLAAACVEAIDGAVKAKEGTYLREEDEAATGRLKAARMLCAAELEALGACRRAAMKMLVDVGLGEDEEEEDGEESEGEEEEGESGESEGEEEGEEEEEEGPASKRQRKDGKEDEIMNRIMDMPHLSESEKHERMQKEFEELDKEEEEKEREDATSRKRARALPGAERWAGSFDNLKNEDEKCTYLEELAVVLTSEQMYFLNKLREVVSDEDSGEEDREEQEEERKGTASTHPIHPIHAPASWATAAAAFRRRL